MCVRRRSQPHKRSARDPTAPCTAATVKASCLTPGRHPEGYLEAFANIYRSGFQDMVARAGGQKVDSSKSLYPNVADGVDGMNFITQCVASSKEDGAWKPLKHKHCRS